MPTQLPEKSPTKRARITATAAAVGLIAGVVGFGPVGVESAEAVPLNTELVVNGGFESGTTGWKTSKSYMTLGTTTAAQSGTRAAVITTTAGTTGVLNDLVSTVASATAGETFKGSASVRTNQAGLDGTLRVRDVSGSTVRTVGQSFSLQDTAWHRVEFTFTAGATGAYFDLNVLGYSMASQQQLIVDNVSLMRYGTTTAPAPPTTTPGAWTLSNGAPLSSRGVPSGGTLLGAAVGSNTNPATFEQAVGQRLGVRRTYWSPTQVSSAVTTAQSDLAAGRLPWMSFKLPYSWAQMASGSGDAWAKDLATRLSKLNGPVWVAFHHEPEGEGNIQDWKKMQERLGPILRSNAPNAGFSVILTGWNQLYGPSQYALDSMWPNTKVDVAGFDVYEFYGTTKDGVLRLTQTDMRGRYFEPISKWAKAEGVAWGLAETGLSDRAAAEYPNWTADTYQDMVETGGVAFAYFNTTLNSTSSWSITSTSKTAQFSRAIKQSPTFPKLV
jgi:hypothetical protein